jgi:hypothetical protein
MAHIHQEEVEGNLPPCLCPSQESISGKQTNGFSGYLKGTTGHGINFSSGRVIL